MSDEFSGIFDDLSPDDFDRTSARSLKEMKTPQSFDAFVQHWLDATRLAYHAADGAMNPAAIMMNKNERLIFSPDDDETLGQYILRLQREAKRHKATWFFTALLTKGGAYEGNTTDGKPMGDLDALQEAERQGAVKPCIYWYAERRDGLADVIRHGIIAVEGGDTGEVFEAPAEHASPLYREVLNADS